MFLRRLRNRGVAMICYAVLLAFITGIGGLFMSDKSLSEAIGTVINHVREIVSGGPTSRLPMKATGISKVQFAALEMQTSIMFDFLSDPESLKKLAENYKNNSSLAAKFKKLQDDLGANYELAAVNLNASGRLKGLWYKTEDDRLVHVSDTTLLDKINGGSKTEANTLWKSYQDNWNGKDHGDPVLNESRPYCAVIGGPDQAEKNKINSNDGMFVAYDKYGNIVEKVNTTGLTVAPGDTVADRRTQMFMSKNGNSDGHAYAYDNEKGFYYMQ